MRRAFWILTALLPCGAAFGATAQAPVRAPGPEVSMAKARTAALARVPGQIRSGELETENGKLLYSFDIKRPHRSGVEEVQVDAHTGAILSVTHESAQSEAKEHRAEHPATTP